MQTNIQADRLENVKHLPDGSIRAACPACRAAGSDKSGEHLLIQPDGKFGCAVHPKDAEHRREIFKLAALKDANAKTILKTYPYCDAAGKLLFEVVRFAPKDFRQRQPDPTALGGWTWNTKGVEKVLFRLPEIIRDVKRGLPIFICEGEKDALAMAEKGFSATCNPGGAGKWQDSFSESLRGADCVIIPDKDEPGRAHGQLVAGKLHGVANSVRVVEMPGDNIKDAAQFFDAGGDAGQIAALVDTAPDWTPAEKEQKPAIKSLPDIVDAANFIAERIEPPAELVAGILHKGNKLAFGGSSKSYKTWTLLNLALSVATGSPWLGFKTKQGKVLFVNFEIQPFAWQKRISAVADALGVRLAPGQISLWNLRGCASDFRLLIPKIIERASAENYALIVLDPVYKLYGRTDENSAGDVAMLLNEVERLAAETGAAIAFGAHFAKGNAAGKEAIDRISGSGVFARDPDSLLIFTKHETQDAFTVEPILRNFAPVQPFVVRWEYPLMQRDDALDPLRLKQVGGRPAKHAPENLLALLPPEGLTNAEWIAKSGEQNIPERTFYRLKNALESTAKIHLSAVTGKYQPILSK